MFVDIAVDVQEHHCHNTVDPLPQVKSFRAVREQETALMIEMIKQSCSSSSSTTVNLSEMLVSLTNGVMCRVALGRKHSGRKFKELLGEVMELLGVFDFGRRYSMACLGE
ncbi:Cytochrome P450 71A24 [Camellia lanceoleosa]|uniref:Cytochrome P450 71A24 n=1 Tax=Camellia lanceoleosa TaxID=1840588 RepID=A0ACC0I017_9ERIC|nr:Cytochrome P450 71A24 [Camellia lanceoleosa]